MPVHVGTIKEPIACKKQSKGFLITDHSYKNIMELSDHLYVLTNGKTVTYSCPFAVALLIASKAGIHPRSLKSENYAAMHNHTPVARLRR